MSLDPSIALQVQPVQIQNPLAQYAQVSAIQDAQARNRLLDLTMQKTQREQTQADAIGNAFSAPGAINADGSFNSSGILSSVAQAGAGSAIPALSKQLTDATTAQLTQQKTKIELGLQQVGALGQVLNGVTDQASYTAALQHGAQAFGAQSIAGLPTIYDPALVAQKKAEALTVQQQLEQRNKELDYALNVRNADETNRHNTATEGTAAGQLAVSQGELGVAKQNANTSQGQLAVAQQNAGRQAAKAADEDQKQRSVVSSGIAAYDQTLKTLDSLETSPGLHEAVGFSSSFPTIGGSKAADFEAKLDTFKAQNFLPMVANLRGMGALSDAEGAKLTNAVGALSTKQSEPAFRQSLKEIRTTLQQSRERLAAQQPAGTSGATAPATSSGKTIVRTGTLNGHRVVQYSDGSTDYQ